MTDSPIRLPPYGPDIGAPGPGARLVNSSTNEGGQVVLYVDVSLDGGTTYTIRAKNVHAINSSDTDVEIGGSQSETPKSSNIRQYVLPQRTLHQAVNPASCPTH